jgi:hypothetical protein
MDKPIYIGECGQGTQSWNDALQSTCELDALNLARSGGYAGLGIWDYQYAGSSEIWSMVNTNGTLRPVCAVIQGWSYTAALNIQVSGANVVLTWPTNATGFTLEYATNLVPPAVWNTNSAPTIVIGGQNTVTNPISGTQMFYRLKQ